MTSRDGGAERDRPKTTSHHGPRFVELDDALRRAAARGARVRLLVSDWSSKPGGDARRDLDALAAVARVEVRVLAIPRWSGGDIPFSRVAHAKFMIVDRGTAWVGTRNWEGDYFTASRIVGVIVVGGQLPSSLDGVFDANWTSPYATRLADVRATSGPFRVRPGPSQTWAASCTRLAPPSGPSCATSWEGTEATRAVLSRAPP